MKLLLTPECHDALRALSRAVDAEAKAAGENVHTLVVAAFVESDPGTRSTAIQGCTCKTCMDLVASTLIKIGEGSVEQDGLVTTAVH